MTAHVRARPEDDADCLGIAPLIADVLLDERVPQLFAILPCSRRRHTARIEAVEIAPRRQYIDAVCRRCARRARLDVTSRESTQRLRDLPLRAAQARHHILHDLMQRMGKGGVHLLRGAGYHGQLHRPRDGLRCIVMRRKEGDERTHLCLDSIQLSPIGHAVRRHALAVCKQLLIVVPRLLGNETDEGFLPAMLHAHECTQEIDQRLARRRTAEDVQPRANLHILEVGHIVVEGIGIVVKGITFVDFPLEMAGGSFLTDKLLRRLDIVRLCCAKMDVLIKSLFQFLDLLKLPRELHRRREVTDEARRTAPLCLNPLPDNRDPVGIDIRQVAQRHIRPAAVRERRALARQPLERAMRPDMNDCIRLPDVAEPVIVADVVVCGSGVRRVEQLAGILAKAARGLHRDEDIPVQRARDEQCPIVIEHITGRIAPVSLELCAHLFRQLREKGAVLRCCQLSIGRLCLLRRHKAAIIGRVIRQQLHERLAALRDLIHDVARRPHCSQQRENALGRVQPRRAADVCIRRGIVVEHNRDFLLRVRLMTQLCPFPCLACHPLHALIQWRIADLAGLIAHLCRNRNGVDHTVKLRHGDAHRDLHRIEPRRRALPLLLWRENGIRLKNGHTERIESLGARTACLERELHRADDNIDIERSIPAKIFFDCFHQCRRFHACVAIGV